ncbi:hypothetical protein JTB14_036064 [Gonioctena quinquepunctata]|nr:hypothetical protein JTB14_036064 [Gonioctena quinquepunctata]
MFRSEFSRCASRAIKFKPVDFLKNLQRNSSTTSTQQEPPRIEKTINNVQLLGRVGADPQRKDMNLENFCNELNGTEWFASNLGCVKQYSII